MAVTVASFQAQYPEFAQADPTMVQSYLNDAINLCPDPVWAPFTDAGVSLTLARMLALSPFARELELVNDEGRTVYDGRLEEMKRMVASGGRVI